MHRTDRTRESPACEPGRPTAVRRRAGRWLPRLAAAALTLPLAAQAATYAWNGSGVAGGNADSNWLAAANWLVDGAAPATPPTTADTVTVTFNQSHTSTVAVVIPAGAQGGDVSFAGLGNVKARGVVFSGDSTFQTFFWNAGVGQNDKGQINSGVTITLLGGSAATPSFKEGVGHDFGSSAGTWLFLAADVHVALLDGAKGLPGTAVFSNATSLINWLGSGNRRLGGSTFRFFPSQRFATNATQNGFLDLSGPADNTSLQSLDPSQPLLTNMASVDVDATISSGGGGYLSFAGGTFNSLLYLNAGNDNNSYLCRPLGAVRLVGSRSLADTNVTRYALYVFRSTNRALVEGGLDLNGQDLTSESPAPVYIGNPGNASGADFTNRSLLAASDSAVSIAGDLVIGINGVLRGNPGTELSLGGSFAIHTAPTLARYYTLSDSLLVLRGAGTPDAPQTLEVHGTAGGGFADNFALGAVQIGTASNLTHVQWVDRHGVGEVQYVAQGVAVTDGSTLDLGGQTLCVGGAGLSVAGRLAGSGTVSGRVAFASAGGLEARLLGTQANAPGAVAVKGAVALDGTLDVTLDEAQALRVGDQFTLIANDLEDPTGGAFANWPDRTAREVGGHLLRLANNGGDGNDVVLTVATAGTAIMLR